MRATEAVDAAKSRSTASAETGSRSLLHAWSRYRWGAGVSAVALFTLLARLPFRYHVPFNADSVNYSLALGHFDLATDQPHPPGNPLYVVLGRLANLAIHDPNQALIAVSLVSSLVAVCGVAVLGAELHGRAAGLWAALFLAVNPFFWLNGEVALAYTTETATAVVLGVASWRSYCRPGVASAVALGAIMALAGGLRPTLLPLLAPLYVFGLWRASWRDRALSAGLAALLTLGWLVPLLAAAGGLAAYLDLARRQALIAGGDSTLLRAPLAAWLGNLGFFSVTLVSAVNLLGALALLGAARGWLRGVRRPGSATVFLCLWLLAPVATFTLVHFGQIGYVLLLLPPLMLLCLPLVDRGLAGAGRAWPPSPGLVASLLACLFLCVPMLRGIAADRAGWDRIARQVHALPADRTVVLAWIPRAGSYRVASYLFPEYQVMGLADQPDGVPGVKFQVAHGTSTFRLDPSVRPCPAAAAGGATHVVILDSEVADLVGDPGAWRQDLLPNGVPLLLRDVPSGIAYVELTGNRIELVPSGQAPPIAPPCSAMP